MTTRADSELRHLLGKAEKSARGDVAAAVRDALEHMGNKSPYRGGRQLLRLLKFAVDRAKEVGDSGTADKLTDAIDYATGKVFVTDFEMKHWPYGGIPRVISKRRTFCSPGLRGWFCPGLMTSSRRTQTPRWRTCVNISK